jgi:hypothetical protein
VADIIQVVNFARDHHLLNYQRLVELKQKYDPTNLSHHNQNIKSAV